MKTYASQQLAEESYTRIAYEQCFHLIRLRNRAHAKNNTAMAMACVRMEAGWSKSKPIALENAYVSYTARGEAK